MAEKNPKILECDRLVVGDGEGTRTEVTPDHFKMFGADGKLRVNVETVDDGEHEGAHIGLHAGGNELDPVVSLSVYPGEHYIRLYRAGSNTLDLAAEMRSTPDGPELTLFGEDQEAIFAVPAGNHHALEDELSDLIAETVDRFVAEHDLDHRSEDILSDAIDYSRGKIRRLRAKREVVDFPGNGDDQPAA